MRSPATEMYSPAAIDSAPPTRPANPESRRVLTAVVPPPTPSISDETETKPSLAPLQQQRMRKRVLTRAGCTKQEAYRMPARSTGALWDKCLSLCDACFSRSWSRFTFPSSSKLSLGAIQAPAQSSFSGMLGNNEQELSEGKKNRRAAWHVTNRDLFLLR